MPNTENIYGAKLAAPLANPTAASVFLTQDSTVNNAQASSAPLKPCVVYLEEYQVDNYNLQTANKFPLGSRVYSLRIYGRVAAGTSGVFNIAVQLGNNTVAANNITIATATAQTYNLLGNWLLTGTLIYDPVSKLLTGNFTSEGGTATALQASTAITPQTVDLSLGKQPLCVTGVFGTSNANNVAYMDQFLLGAL